MLVRTVHHNEYFTLYAGTPYEVRVYANGVNNLDGGQRIGIEMYGAAVTKEDIHHVTTRELKEKRMAECNN